MMIKTILLVGLGGGVGSILRYLTSMLVTTYFHTVFPLATFVVNVLGCLAVGLITGFLESRQILNFDLKVLLITGFCGGYTTFSTFSAENINLFRSGHSLAAFIYLSASILIGLSAVWLGLALTKASQQ
jgi:CrcB protein